MEFLGILLSAPLDFVETLREHKAEVLSYLRQQQEDTLPSPHRNPAQCHNPLTPHATHELPWEW